MGDITAIDMVNFTTAITGAVTGIISLWLQLSQTRVKLRVVPRIAYMMPGQGVISGDRPSEEMHYLRKQGRPARLCIEVVNLSAFPVTVSDVGFGRTNKRRHCLIKPDTTEGKSFPTKLEPREAVTLLSVIGHDLDPKIMTHAVAYAETDCGTVRYGTSPIFREYVESLKAA